MRRAAGRTVAVTLLAALAVLTTGCTLGGSSDPSAPYFPKTRPVASTPAPVDPALTVPLAPVVVSGAVSRPKPDVTPGVVELRDVGVLCQQPKRSTHPPIPTSWDQAIFAGYNISVHDQGKYRLDYLVPLQLGGAQAQANLWPMSLRGVGFHEKQRLNARLRTIVCQGQMPLNQAQHDIAADWYTLWVKYGA